MPEDAFFDFVDSTCGTFDAAACAARVEKFGRDFVKKPANRQRLLARVILQDDHCGNKIFTVLLAKLAVASYGV